MLGDGALLVLAGAKFKGGEALGLGVALAVGTALAAVLLLSAGQTIELFLVIERHLAAIREQTLDHLQLDIVGVRAAAKKAPKGTVSSKRSEEVWSNYPRDRINPNALSPASGG
jgi:hypothetical protein